MLPKPVYRKLINKNCTLIMENNNKALTPQVILAWLFVGLPLIWGVSQTIIKSLTLFS